MSPIRLSLFLSLLGSSILAQDASSNMGHARARRMASLGRLPSSAEIVVDHMVNYHRHEVPLPRAGEDVAMDLRWDAPLPAHLDESVLQIGLATKRLHDLRRMPADIWNGEGDRRFFSVQVVINPGPFQDEEGCRDAAQTQLSGKIAFEEILDLFDGFLGLFYIHCGPVAGGNDQCTHLLLLG